MKIKHVIFGFLIFIVFTYISFSNGIHAGTATKVNILSESDSLIDVFDYTNKDTLISPREQEGRIFKISYDTLKIFTLSDYINYPLGKYRKIKAVEKKFPFMKMRVEYDYSYGEQNKLYRFYYNNSFFKLYYDDYANTLEIVSAKIVDKDIKLLDGISTGIPKRKFLSKISVKLSQNQISNTRVIKLQSGLDNLCHYYTFENDTLKTIYIDNVYYFNEK